MKLFGTDFNDYKVVEKEIRSPNNKKTRKVYYIKVARYFLGFKYYFYFYETKKRWSGIEEKRTVYSFDDCEGVLRAYNYFVNMC